MLAPAACYPVYPIVAARGAVPAGGLIFDVAGDCFRREPPTDIDRFQSFRMREYVRIGTPEQIQAFRERWIERAKGIADRWASATASTSPATPSSVVAARSIAASASSSRR